MANNENTTSNRIQGADGVRALACLWVFWHHAAIVLDKGGDFWSGLIHDQGREAVAVFFVLSGMLLTLPFWQAALGQRPAPLLGKYLIARLGRIIPAYYVCLFVTWALFPMVSDHNWRAFAGLTCTNWMHWKTFFPASNNPALWSIGVEVAFYLLLPVWAWGLMRTGGKKWGAVYWLATQMLLAGIQVLFLSKLRVDNTMAFSYDPGQMAALDFMDCRNPLGLFSHFLCGGAASGLLAIWPNPQRADVTQPRWFNRFDMLAVLCLAGTAILLGSQMLPEPVSTWINRAQVWKMQYRWPLLPALVSVLLMSLHHSRTMGKWFDNALLRGVCLISYGIYLWHMVVLELVARRWPWSTGSLSSQVVCGTVCLMISCLAATASFYMIEQPAMNWLKARRPQTSPVKGQAVPIWTPGVSLEAAKS